MDETLGLLETVRDRGLARGRLRGLFHVAIGRKVTRANGAVVSLGLTWRELADRLKALRFDPELVRELGADPDTLSPRDRNKFWYAAIGLARVDSPAAVAQAEKLAADLKPLGFVVGPAPSGGAPPAAQTAVAAPKPKAVEPEPPAAKKKPQGKPKK